METFSVAFIADITLAAGSLGILRLVHLKFGETPLLPPLAILCGSGAAIGIFSGLGHLAVSAGDMQLAQELARAVLMGSAMALPAFAHVLTIYPRRIEHPAIPWGIAVLYAFGIVHALLAPTRFIVEGYSTEHGEPVPIDGALQPYMSFPTYAFLAAAIAWLAYLAVRGRTAVEEASARILLLAAIPAGFLSAGLPALGWPAGHPNFPSAQTLAFGWGILFAGAAIYGGWWRPPVAQGLQAILDASTDGILIFGEEGRLLTANHAARQAADLGARRVEGLTLLEALPPELRERAGDLLTMSVMGVIRGRIDRNTHEIPAQQGGERSFVVNVLPVGEGERGAGRGALVVLRDETDRIALAGATARLANLQDLVIRVLGHDVKTPLAVIQGYAELARGRMNGPVDEKAAGEVGRHIDRILEAVTSSQIILSNARAISRLAAGPGASVAFEDLDVARMARQAGEVMQPLAHAKGLTLSVDAPGKTLARAPKGFESVFMNLLSNAVKYTPPGGSIELTMHREDGRAVFRVADTGPGIDPDKRDKLFAKFERLDAESGKIEGQGLGLSIVASFVDLVGGNVRVEDRPDGRSGCVFIVELLASQGAAPAPTSSSPAGS